MRNRKPAAAQLPMTLRDLILETSYWKSTRLDVPVFLPANKADRMQFCDEAVLGLPLDGLVLQQAFAAAVAALRSVFHESVRVEPLNIVLAHRMYPSPRGIYPVYAALRLSDGESDAVLRYDGEQHALLIDDGVPSLKPVTGISLEVVGALDEIAPLYGALAPTLCALESGHIARELAIALGKSSPDCRLEAAEAPHDADACADGLTFARIVIPHVEATSLDWSMARALRVRRPRRTAEGDRRSAAARKSMASATVPPRAIWDGAIPQRGDSVAAHRSSGNSVSAIFGSAVAACDVDELQKLLIARWQTARGNCAPETVALRLLRPRPPYGVDVIDAASGEVTPVDGGLSLLADAFGTMYNIDLETVPLVGAFCARFDVHSDALWSYAQTLVEAGVYAQDLCMAAAGLEFFARPFKGSVEIVLETTFDLPGQMFYSLLFGRGGTSNPSLRIVMS